jgi:hypothetical protein
MSNKLKEIYGTLKLVMPEYDIELYSDDAVRITPKDSSDMFQGITINNTKQNSMCIEVLNMDIHELDWMFNVKEIPIEEAFCILDDYNNKRNADRGKFFCIIPGKGGLNYYTATLKDNYGKKR